MSDTATDRVTVGAFAGSYGVQGEVRLKSFCADPAAIADYCPLETPDGLRIDQIVLTGQLSNGFSARVSVVTSKEEADALKGTPLLADRARLPSLPDDEFYYADLIGLVVLDSGGTTLGTVKTLMDHGAGDLLEVTLSGSSDSVLIPFTKAAVPTVDLGAGRIVVDPPAGTFPD